jgi:hypothetical protein
VVDVFEEVEEQIRSDRYKTLALKVLPWLAAVLLLAILAAAGYWGYRSYNERQAAAASEQYAQAMEAFQRGDRNRAQQLWTEVSASGAKGYRALALNHLGGLALSDNRTADAVKFFDQAAEAAPSNVLGDLARLKSAFALLDTAPYKDLEARLTPLIEEGRPYRAEAREALAFAKLMAGNTAGARGDFVVNSLSADVGEGARQRAQAAIAMIDSGAAKSVAAAAKAAAALPPPTQVPPGALSPALQPAPQP